MTRFSLSEGKMIESDCNVVCSVMDYNEYVAKSDDNTAATEWIMREHDRLPYCKAQIEDDFIIGAISTPGCNKKQERSFFFIFSRENLELIQMSENLTIYLEKLMAQRHSFASVNDIFLTLLDCVLLDDSQSLYQIEKEMEILEEKILADADANINSLLLSYRKNIISIHNYYEQMINLADTIEYTEFFPRNELHFMSFRNRLQRLDAKVQSLRDYCAQIREIFHSQTDIKANRIMQTLTVITTLFMPVTVISAWFGMNFVNMPELKSPFGYIITIIITVVLTISAILYCKHKKIL